MRFSTANVGEGAAAPARKSPPGHRVGEYVAIAIFALSAVVIYHGPERVETPPFVPPAFVFTDSGEHIHAEGCFVGSLVSSRINRQQIDVDLRARTIDVHEIVAVSFGNHRNELFEETRQYQIVADDGDTLIATRRHLPDGTLTELQIGRKTRTVMVISHLSNGAFSGPVLVSELKDGPTVFRKIQSSRRPWY